MSAFLTGWHAHHHLPVSFSALLQMDGVISVLAVPRGPVIRLNHRRIGRPMKAFALLAARHLAGLLFVVPLAAVAAPEMGRIFALAPASGSDGVVVANKACTSLSRMGA
jgi:hypothetical protein